MQSHQTIPRRRRDCEYQQDIILKCIFRIPARPGSIGTDCYPQRHFGIRSISQKNCRRSGAMCIDSILQEIVEKLDKYGQHRQRGSNSRRWWRKEGNSSSSDDEPYRRSNTATPVLTANDIIEYHVSQTPTSDKLAFPGIDWGYAQVLDLFDIKDMGRCGIHRVINCSSDYQIRRYTADIR